MMKIKTNKKIAGAAAMLLLSTTMLGTSTFAWFTMNKSVTVDGMEVRTKVSSNLLVSATNSEATFENSLTQTVKGLLEPTSTVDGITYYYTATDNVYASGDAIAETYSRYDTTGLGAATDTAKYTNAFSENYGITKTDAAAVEMEDDKAIGYIDYAFYLKGVNSTGSAQNIILTNCNLLYDGAAITGDEGNAWRAAMFVQAAQKDTAVSTAIATTDRVTILAHSDADNFTDTKAVNSTTTLGDVTYGNDAIVGSVAANGSAWYKVTVRLWLEGEDETCNNETYAALTKHYSLDLKFELAEDAGTPATAITSVAPVAP